MKFFWECGLIQSSNKIRGLLSLVFLVSLILILTDCTSHPKGPPGKGVLGADQFVDLLVDIHYYEGVFSIADGPTSFRADGRIASDTIDFYKPVLDRHGITREEFQLTIHYYSYHPTRFEAIYNKVIDRLSKKLHDAEIESRKGE
jgi:hypothetical protein